MDTILISIIMFNENDVVNESSHTVTIPNDVVINGDLNVDFQDGNGHHTLSVTADDDHLRINGDKLVINNDDVGIHDSNLVVEDTRIIHNKTTEIIQETTTDSDGIHFIYNMNKWQIYINEDDDLVFSYNDTLVFKLSHD